MKKRNSKSGDQQARLGDLAQMARQIDSRLGDNANASPQQSHAPMVGTDDSNLNPESQVFSADQLSELRQAEAALRFLKQIRRDKVRAAEHPETLAINDTDDDESTINDEQTVVDDTDGHPLIKQLGRFQILQTIGQGGFAKVFLARDPTLNRMVALKVPGLAGLASSESRQRFEREAAAAAVLSHPAIVPVFETGNVGPAMYIASEYCPGVNLASWFAKRSAEISCQQAAAIVARLAEAVQHAHQRGIVHRDLKPANIMVVNGNEPVEQRLRITDFGLAKDLESVDATLTVEGAIVGTPAYMSPEQASGCSEIGLTTDVFSLGVILFELLTGKLPHRKGNHIATLRSIEGDIPENPCRLNSAVPKDLAAICLKCLAKKPADRYSNAYDLSSDLVSWMQGRGVTARHPSKLEKLLRWTRRQPALAAALMFAFLSLATGALVATNQWRIAKQNLVDRDFQFRRAEANLQQSRQNEKQAVKMHQSAQDSLRLARETIRGMFVDVLVTADIAPEKRNQFLQTAIELQTELLHDNPGDFNTLHELAVLNTMMARSSMRAGQYDSAEQSAAKADIWLQRLSQLNGDREIDDWIDVRALLAEIDLIRFQTTDPDAIVDSISQDCKPIQKVDRLYIAAGAAISQQDYDKAIEIAQLGRQAIKDSMRSGMIATIKDLCFLATLGQCHTFRGDSENGKALLEEALAGFESLGSNMPPHNDLDFGIGNCMHMLGITHFQLQEFGMAEQRFDQAHRMFEYLVRRDARDMQFAGRLLSSMIYQARIKRQQGKQKDAERRLLQAIELFEGMSDSLKLRLLTVEHASEAWGLLAEIYEQQENAVQARQARSKQQALFAASRRRPSQASN